MKGDDTRFLTGTDEHSINIAQSAVDEGRPARAFVDEKVGYFRVAEDALAISPDRFIRTTDPDHVRAAQEMVRRAHANGDIYLGTYEGWYCPNEGFRNATDVQETARGTICPNHPEVPLQWLTEKNWFFRLSAYQERLERHFADHPDFVQPDYRRNEMLGFIRGGLEDFSISRERTPGGWGIPFPIAEDGESGAARGRLVGSRRPASSTSGTTRSSTTSRAPASRTIRRRSTTGGRPTCTSSARTSPGSTRSSGRRCCGAPGWRRRATCGSTAGCWPPAASG